MRTRVALLGASGIVAQRFQQRLANHPWFELAAIFGSKNTAGKRVGDLTWKLEEPRPNLPDLTVQKCDISELSSQLEKLNIQLVFSALPSTVADQLERVLAKSGCRVFSNSSAHRMDDDVPLVIADLNPHHLLLLRPPFREAGSGFIACSTNCTVVPAGLPLKPIWDMIGIRHIRIRTQQALSGGGYPLLEEADSAGEVSAEIPGEAEKITEELRRILGRVGPTGIGLASFTTDVECSRVMRRHGHHVEVEATLSKAVDLEELNEWMNPYRGRAQALNLPSAPDLPFILSDKPIQPELDRWSGFQGEGAPNPASDLRAGMSVIVSDLSIEGNIMRFNAFSDNTLRGAAGGCVLLAELAKVEGLLD
jgi:aspartate-semialdehyde dehydrogenase